MRQVVLAAFALLATLSCSNAGLIEDPHCFLTCEYPYELDSFACECVEIQKKGVPFLLRRDNVVKRVVPKVFKVENRKFQRGGRFQKVFVDDFKFNDGLKFRDNRRLRVVGKFDDDRRLRGDRKFRVLRKFDDDRKFRGDRKFKVLRKFDDDRKFRGDRKFRVVNKFDDDRRFRGDRKFRDNSKFRVVRTFDDSRRFKGDGKFRFVNDDKFDKVFH